MKLIIGLGNPGSQYEQTRHNVGFRVVDMLASKHGWKWEKQGRAMIATGTLGTEKIVLVKPITFMNKSGEAIGELLRWYKLKPEDTLVIYDDLDLPVGRVRLRGSGSAGGHNGISSIISHLHTNEFPRLRVGIGRPANAKFSTVDYVLGATTGDERIQLDTGESGAIEQVALILQQGLEAAMNIINVDPEAKKKAEEKRRLQLERREQERLRKQHEQEAQQDKNSENREDIAST